MMAGDVFSAALTPGTEVVLGDYGVQPPSSVESSFSPATLSAGRANPNALDAEGEASGSGFGAPCDSYGPISVTIDPVASSIDEGEGQDGYAGTILPFSGTASANVSYVEVYVDGVMVANVPEMNSVWETRYPYRAYASNCAL